MKTILSFILALFIVVACNESGSGDPEIPKLDTTQIKKDTNQVVSLFSAAPAAVLTVAINPYDPHCGGLPPYKDSIKFAGNFYGFCGPNCKKKFISKPSDYLK